MTTNPENFRPRDSVGSQQYLDSTIRTASPARLRLMTIERSVEVAGTLAAAWRSKQQLGSNEHSLKLLDLLNELLSGVTKGATPSESEVCRKVADLYVFLVKHVITAEETSDAAAIDEIRLVLETEAETWRAVCANEAGSVGLNPHFSNSTATATSGLNFEA